MASERYLMGVLSHRQAQGPVYIPDRDKGRPTWMTAARMGSIDMLNKAFAAGIAIDTEDANGTTPLHVCASYDRIMCAKHLISRGANAAHANNWGDTPLHRAASQGFAEMCELLLQAGAKLNAKDWQDKTADDYAKDEGHRDVVRVFRAWRSQTPLSKFSETIFEGDTFEQEGTPGGLFAASHFEQTPTRQPPVPKMAPIADNSPGRWS